MKYFWLLFCLILTSACKNNPQMNVDKENPDFSTNDASELFFKNVRQVYYDLEEQAPTKLRLYRIKTRRQVADSPILHLALVHNWRYDEAYIILEPNAYFIANIPIQVLWQSPESNQEGTYQFVYGSKQAHFKFASEIYESILANQQLFILEGKKRIPFLDNRVDRENFRKSMKDYYNLIGINQ